MEMTVQQRRLVQRTFVHIAPEHASVARLFYDRLFEIAPETRDMFKHSMEAQRGKVMQMLASLVDALENSERFTRTTRALGKRHISYGVENAQYALVGDALIWALREACPLVMTDAVTRAWTLAYTTMAESAIAGAST